MEPAISTAQQVMAVTPLPIYARSMQVAVSCSNSHQTPRANGLKPYSITSTATTDGMLELRLLTHLATSTAQRAMAAISAGAPASVAAWSTDYHRTPTAAGLKPCSTSFTRVPKVTAISADQPPSASPSMPQATCMAQHSTEPITPPAVV